MVDLKYIIGQVGQRHRPVSVRHVGLLREQWTHGACDS